MNEQGAPAGGDVERSRHMESNSSVSGRAAAGASLGPAAAAAAVYASNPERPGALFPSPEGHCIVAQCHSGPVTSLSLSSPFIYFYSKSLPPYAYPAIIRLNRSLFLPPQQHGHSRVSINSH